MADWADPIVFRILVHKTALANYAIEPHTELKIFMHTHCRDWDAEKREVVNRPAIYCCVDSRTYEQATISLSR